MGIAMEHGKIYVDVNMGMSTWILNMGKVYVNPNMGKVYVFQHGKSLCLPTWETQHGYVPFLFLFLFGKRVP
jgi:hypothetical protein